MQVERQIAVCGVCGGPRNPNGASLCKGCYSKPEIRHTYQGTRATQPLPFSTHRIELVTIEPKARKPRQPRRSWKNYRPFWDGTAVPITFYQRPQYAKAQERLRMLFAPENIWRPGQYETPTFRKPKAPRVRVSVDRRVVLSYPFVAKPRDEHAELLAVNALVPQMPGREDICQEIMLALWERKITLEQIKVNRVDLRAFVRAFTKENYEAGGFALSLDQPMHDGRSWHDVLAAPAE